MGIDLSSIESALVEAAEQAVKDAVEELDTSSIVEEITNSRDFERAVESAIDSGVEHYDFSDAIADAAENYDFSEHIDAALEHYDPLESKVDEAIAERVETAVNERLDAFKAELPNLVQSALLDTLKYAWPHLTELLFGKQ